MIFKEFDSKQEVLTTLKNLLKESNSEKQKALISQDLTLLTNGIESEKQNAYYIDFYVADSKNLIALHDIRLEHNGRTAQIDHMIINRFGIELLESKSFKGTLTINDDNSLEVNYNGKIKSFPNPLEQSKRHADVLQKFIEDNASLGKRVELLGGFNVKSIVLIHPETTITNKKLPDNFFRADTYMSKRIEEVDKIGVLEVFKLVSKMIDINSVKELAELIKSAHKPLEFDYANKYKISKPKKEVLLSVEKEVENLNVPDDQPIETQKEKLKEGDPCPFCQNTLVLRKGKNEANFLGCNTFPKCRFTRRVAKI
jgi:hypothetical protein